MQNHAGTTHQQPAKQHMYVPQRKPILFQIIQVMLLLLRSFCVNQGWVGPGVGLNLTSGARGSRTIKLDFLTQQLKSDRN